MKLSDRSRIVVSKIEIIIAAVMFFIMLVSCGLYINIKLNGKISGLPPLSENDAKMLLRSSVSDEESYSDNLLEPVFIGISREGKKSAVFPLVEERRSIRLEVFDSLVTLFSGTSVDISFENDAEILEYIDDIKTRNDYILLSFYKDLPSSVILPCILDNYREIGKQNVFQFRHLFLLPDYDGNLFACAVSENNDVTELYPEQSVRFDKILNKSYDISESWSEFEFLDSGSISPVLLSSIRANEYLIQPFATLHGKDVGQRWIRNVFDVFSLNVNLVRSFTSGDSSEINYVEESGELIVNDDGDVEYKASESGGVILDEYLGYITDNDETVLSFSDKIFVLKKIINRLNENDGLISYSMTGISYDTNRDTLHVFFKYMSDGIFLYSSPYDAIFEIKGNKISHATFKAITCRETEDYQTVVVPQKYAVISAGVERAKEGTYLVLSGPDSAGFRRVFWSCSPAFTEVNQ